MPRHQIGVLGYTLLQGILTGKYASLDEVPPARLRTRHFRGDRPGSRHGQPGEEALVMQTLAGIAAVAKEEGVEMADLALAWSIAKPGITFTLAGVRNLEQLEAKCAGVAGPVATGIRLDAHAAAARPVGRQRRLLPGRPRQPHARQAQTGRWRNGGWWSAGARQG